MAHCHSSNQKNGVLAEEPDESHRPRQTCEVEKPRKDHRRMGALSSGPFHLPRNASPGPALRESSCPTIARKRRCFKYCECPTLSHKSMSDPSRKHVALLPKFRGLRGRRETLEWLLMSTWRKVEHQRSHPIRGSYGSCC
ncbi:hypothetical protein BDP81DRAFT_83451 [Colletotrichum phormii]|uniref:Uncharacterized protein n=1 Tax=Colletotrichum phormii TaxID=359342 RepID=A0AAJ0A3P3_9PEZI|nr:uncharacterized protein BDP81DRAFT_83451 [Colletotrichum phormii]KAK1654442.1 hypothetical protein BDP81DRAFT_83451 [Colletotrichum phormii]